MSDPMLTLQGSSAFDKVVYFFETVFTGSAKESPETTARINQLIEASFESGYTYNGQPQTPQQLIAWRQSLLQRFVEMTFHVHNAISSPIDGGPTGPSAGVTIAWVVQGVDSAGVTWQLRGMNMLGQKNGKAFTNNQMGDPQNGWQKVAATKA